MFITTVSPNTIDDRIAAESNAPEFAECALKLARCGLTLRKLGDIVTSPINNSIRDVAEAYQQEGGTIPLFRPADIKGVWLDVKSALRVSSQFEAEHEKARVVPGNIVIAAAGTVARAARVPNGIAYGAINGSCARVVVPGEADGFVLAYLTSRHGFLSLMRWAVGSVQKHLNLEDIPRVTVPWPDQVVLRYFGDKVRQAERLQSRAENLLTSATGLVDLLIDGAMTEDEIKAHDIDRGWLASPQQQDTFGRAKHARTKFVDLTNRIDAWYYQPHLVAAYQKIKASGNCQNLAEVIDNDRDVKGGATPLGAEYLSSGTVRFYRTSEVSGMAVHAAHAVFISDEQDREMARSRLADGDVLLTITGADFGHAGVITKRHLPGNISQHSVRFRPTIDASYLVAYLESSYGQRMIWRQAYGATRPAIDYPGVKSLLIRVPDPAVQKVIGDAVRSGVLARDCASWLVSGAKLLVEALIEGKITEDELVIAQKALERGDRAIDQAILSRLTEDGIDVVGKPPLFLDLDALYSVIDETQRNQPSSGDAA